MKVDKDYQTPALASIDSSRLSSRVCSFLSHIQDSKDSIAPFFLKDRVSPCRAGADREITM